MRTNKDIWVLAGGVGYGVLDTIRDTYPKRFINCEASEQAMVDIAVGLSRASKIPFVYAITPHLYRAFESIRNYIDHEKIPVHLVGVGRGRDYGNLGFTHWAEDDLRVFSCFPHIQVLYPYTKEEVVKMVGQAIGLPTPTYLNLPR